MTYPFKSRAAPIIQRRRNQRRSGELALRIQLNFPDELDDAITGVCTRLWHRSSTLDALTVVLAKWTPITMLIVIVISSTGFGLTEAQKGAANATLHGGVSIASALLARILNEPISKAVSRPRPFEIHGWIPLLGHERGEAFPSNHATGAFALAMGFYGVPGYFAILMTLAILLSVSRLYCGVHHLTDILAGALHGSVVAALVLTFASWIW
jgi:undecaprenyl-diphosphatase